MKIREALAEPSTGRTTFSIARRLSTLRDVDRILVIDGGRLVDYRRHEDLLSRGEICAGLHEAQF